MMFVRKHFDSVAEFCSAPFVDKAAHAKYLSKLRRNNDTTWNSEELLGSRYADEWLGAPSLPAADRRVTHGWAEGAAMVRKCFDELTVAAPVGVKRRHVMTSQGDELDIHQMYRGDLEHAWHARRRKHIRARMSVRLVVQTNMLSTVDQNQLFWRGAATLKLAETLTNAGYAVEIVGVQASNEVHNVKGKFVVSLTLKQSSEPLDEAALAGVICNVAFHRLYGFRMYSACMPDGRRMFGDSCTSDVSGALINEADFGADGTPTFVIGYKVTSKAAADAVIASTLTALDEQQAV